MKIDIHERLVEWGRFVRVRHVQGHCLSIEWRFRRHVVEGDTPTGWNDWMTTPPIVPGPPINALRALEVERCMRWLPNGHREALRLRYVDRLTHRGMCKRLHLAYDTGERFFEDAQSMVYNRLRKSNAKIYNRTTAGRDESQGARLMPEILTV